MPTPLIHPYTPYTLYTLYTPYTLHPYPSTYNLTSSQVYLPNGAYVKALVVNDLLNIWVISSSTDRSGQNLPAVVSGLQFLILFIIFVSHRFKKLTELCFPDKLAINSHYLPYKLYFKYYFRIYKIYI